MPALPTRFAPVIVPFAALFRQPTWRHARALLLGGLSGVLHMLLHMAEAGRPITSGTLAGAMQTNAVVVCRVMAGLWDAGIVRSEKGHGGGWSLARDPAAVTLYDVYAALGAPAPFALGHRHAAPTCLVEQAVNAALDATLREAEALLLARMGPLPSRRSPPTSTAGWRP